MKNIIVRMSLLLLAICLFLMLAVSCSDSDTVNDALESTAELEGIDADVYFNVYASHGSLSKKILAQESILVNGDSAKVTIGEYGKDGSDICFDGHNAYFDGYKESKYDYEKYFGSYKAFTEALLSVQIDELLFEKAESSEIAGKLIFKKTVSEEEEREAFNKTFKGFFSHIEARLNALVGCSKCQNAVQRCDDCALKDVLFEGTYLEVVVKDGYVEKIRVKFDMFAILDGLDTSLNVDLEMNINSPGKDVNVEFPNGYASFAKYERSRTPIIEDWFRKK